MIIRRGHARRSAWEYFSIHHRGVCDGLARRAPNSPAPPRTLDDVRYYVAFATGAYMQRRIARSNAIERHARTLARQGNATPL